MVKIYHNPRCSKSREALGLLQEKNVEFEVVEYLKEVPTVEEMTKLLQMLNIKPEELLRKGEAIFKEKYKGLSLTDIEWIEAMIENPKLIERPIVVNGYKAVVGRPPVKVLDIL